MVETITEKVMRVIECHPQCHPLTTPTKKNNHFIWTGDQKVISITVKINCRCARVATQLMLKLCNF